ncbi:MAG: OmpA family protein, partial [Pseudomonadota bacterium]
STLRSNAQLDLEAAFGQLRERTFRRILIVGHTDATGSSETNLSLGLDRAAAVQSVLLANAPAFEGLVDVETRGEKEPIASNETPSGRAKNRRVEIVLIE